MSFFPRSVGLRLLWNEHWVVFYIAFGVFLILEKPWFEVLEFAFVDFVLDMQKNVAEVGFFGKDVANALQLAFESHVSLFGVF